MSTINKVAILGAGAMGAYFATQFFNAPDFSTSLIARDQRKEHLKKDGIVVNGKPYLIPIVDPEEAETPVDLIIVAVKHHQLKDAVQHLGKLVGDATLFISVMNGLDSEETIGAMYGMGKILYAISVGIDALRVGNQVTYTKPGIHYFGEAKNFTTSAKVQRVRDAFEHANISFQVPEDMLRMLWWKFMINVGVNQASAILRAPYGVFNSNPDAQGLMESLMHEVITLANATNVNLTDQDIKDWYPVMNRLSPQGKTSMLQDIEAKRKTEVEAFSGKVIELGKAHQIATPVNQIAFQIIRIFEQSF